MDLNTVMQMAFTAISAIIAHTFRKLVLDINELTKSVNSLNEKMAVVIEKIERHDEDIKELKNKR